MKNKPFLVLSVLAAFFIILFFSCQKFETSQVNINEEGLALKDANFSSEFKWESTRNITLNISSEDSQIVTITSTDKLIRYYKGMLSDNSQTYVVKISVPTHVEMLNINNQELNLDSDNISITL